MYLSCHELKDGDIHSVSAAISFGNLLLHQVICVVIINGIY